MFQIISNNKNTCISKEIDLNYIYEEFNYSQKKNILIKIQLDGYFWSEANKLYTNELDKEQQQ